MMENIFMVMQDITKMMDAIEGAYKNLKDLDREEFMGVLGTIVDQWAADHDMTLKETQTMMADLAQVQKLVHKEEGPMFKSMAL